jgi:flagellar P-ring protein precursor FlgI
MQRHAIILALLLLVTSAAAERIKDVATIKGERGNPLQGVGLVIGLNGTGDNSELTKRMLAAYLRRNNIAVSKDDLGASNASAVVITADLGPFNRVGSKIDIHVSMIEGSSLKGGKLLMTPLHGADGRTYAVAQGALVLGGYSAGGSNATVTKGITTTGTIPNGATVEREETADIIENGEITLLMMNPDHSTAESAAKAINAAYPNTAHAADAGTIRIKLPEDIDKTNLNGFIDKIGKLDVTVDQPARVVISEDTGTVVIGQNVGISTVAISHGNIMVTTEEKNYASQPAPFSSSGDTVELTRTSTTVTEAKGTINVVPRQMTVTELAQALNAMGLAPSDLIAIFTKIKAAGALQAELVIK